MGKDRVKGNLIPASSSSATNKVSFAAFRQQGVNEVIPEHIVLLLRKLSKKDTVTRQKSLLELQNHDLQSLLPEWGRHFRKLVMDTDKRVRDLLVLVHKKVVLDSGKRVQQYLNDFICMWMILNMESVESLSFFDSLFFNKKQQLDEFCSKRILSDLEQIFTMDFECVETKSRITSGGIRVLANYPNSDLVNKVSKFMTSPHVEIRIAMGTLMNNINSEWMHKLPKLLFNEENEDVAESWWSSMLRLNFDFDVYNYLLKASSKTYPALTLFISNKNADLEKCWKILMKAKRNNLYFDFVRDLLVMMDKQNIETRQKTSKIALQIVNNHYAFSILKDRINLQDVLPSLELANIDNVFSLGTDILDACLQKLPLFCHEIFPFLQRLQVKLEELDVGFNHCLDCYKHAISLSNDCIHHVFNQTKYQIEDLVCVLPYSDLIMEYIKKEPSLIYLCFELINVSEFTEFAVQNNFTDYFEFFVLDSIRKVEFAILNANDEEWQKMPKSVCLTEICKNWLLNPQRTTNEFEICALRTNTLFEDIYNDEVEQKVRNCRTLMDDYYFDVLDYNEDSEHIVRKLHLFKPKSNLLNLAFACFDLETFQNIEIVREMTSIELMGLRKIANEAIYIDTDDVRVLSAVYSKLEVEVFTDVEIINGLDNFLYFLPFNAFDVQIDEEKAIFLIEKYSNSGMIALVHLSIMLLRLRLKNKDLVMKILNLSSKSHYLFDAILQNICKLNMESLSEELFEIFFDLNKNEHLKTYLLNLDSSFYNKERLLANLNEIGESCFLMLSKLKPVITEFDSIFKWRLFFLNPYPNPPLTLLLDQINFDNDDYLNCLKHFPKETRNWYSNLKETYKSYVEQKTIQIFTPKLMQFHVQNCKNITVLKSQSTIFKKTTKIDEFNLEFLITFPQQYPLKVAKVSCTSRVAVTESKLRGWILSCETALESSSVSFALSILDQNIEMYLKGVPDCPICYSIVDSLKCPPQRACPTCKNKFHASCLFKWIKKAPEAKCPLCRSFLQ